MVLEQTAASIKGFGKLSEFGKSVSNVTRWIIITYLIHPVKSLVLSSFMVVID